MGKAKTPPLVRDLGKAEAWLKAQLAQPQPDPVYKRLRLALDTLNRYRWTAEELAQWWGQRPPIDPNGV